MGPAHRVLPAANTLVPHTICLGLRWNVFLTLAIALSSLTGCQNLALPVPTSAIAAVMHGHVHGGQQPVTNSLIQLYAVGTSGVASAAQPLVTQPVYTDSNGDFSLTTYTCPSASAPVYLTSMGGFNGYGPNGAGNSAIALMAMLGPCGAITDSTFVDVNEVTTIGSIWPVASYMTSATALGSAANDATFEGAVSSINEFINVGAGTSPGTPALDSYFGDAPKLYALADIVASCVNSAGGSAGDGSPCGNLFRYAQTATGRAPDDTISAALSIAQNPTRNVEAIFDLSPPNAPFEPTLTASPSDWTLNLTIAPEAPVISPGSGTYPAGQPITLSDETPGAVLHYTLTGSQPTAASPVYTGPLTLSSTETVEAIAIEGEFTSAVAQANLAVQTPHLVFSTQPSNAIVGGALVPVPTVSIVSASGAIQTAATCPVTLTAAGGGAPVKLTGTTSMPAVNGIASFPGLSLGTAGTYTLVASCGTYGTVTSTSFNILATTLPIVQAVQSDNFVDSIGVNVHFSYPVYVASAATLELDLKNMGIRHVRDGMVTGSPSFSAIHNQLAAYGIHTLYIEPSQSMGPETSYDSYVNDVEAFEPPNEQNIVGSNSSAPVASSAAAYSSFLETAAQLVPAGYPFLGPSFTAGGDTAAFTAGGYHYASSPTVTVSGGGGNGMSCTASLGKSSYGDNQVTACSCKGGSGYSSAPSVAIVPSPSDSFGMGATAIAGVKGGTAAGCTVQNLSLAPTSYAINNLHYYQAGFMPETGGWGGGDFYGNSYGSLAYVKDQFTVTSSALPTWATEAGYYTSIPAEGALPEANLAAYIPRLLLNNFGHGVSRTYLYELLDEGVASSTLIASNPGQAEQYSYGLIHNDGSFKPSYTAISSLIALLADPGTAFTPGSLPLTISGSTSNVHQMLFQKRDGSYWLALWIAAQGYNVNTQAETPVSPQAITVTVGGTPQMQGLYQMNSTGNFSQTPESGTTLRFSVNDEVSFIKIM